MVVLPRQHYSCPLLLLFSWPSFREVYPNCDVVMFQPWKGTPPGLGSIANCYVAILLIPAPPFSALHPMSAWGGGYLLVPLPFLPCQPSCLHTVSFFHPGVTCLRNRMPMTIYPFIRLRYLTASPALVRPNKFPMPRPLCRLNLL